MDQSGQQLTEAFEWFNAASKELTEAYRDLERQVGELGEQLAAARDERLQELAAKEEVADRLKTLFDLMPAALVVLDASERVSEVNPAAYELLGSELVGQPWHLVLSSAGATRDSSGDELILFGRFQITSAGAALTQSGGRILLLQDVSETRRLQSQLERTHRLAAMGEMVAGAAHQLRTPLATALLQVSRLAGDSAEADAALREVRRLDRLVHDMLVFARGGDLGAVPHPLGSCIDELQDRFAASFAERGGELRLASSVPTATVNVNREALLSALANLFHNALDAVEDGPVLTIEVEAGADGVYLHLRDNGPGIQAGNRDRIFEPFFTTRAEGTGLGLAVTAEVLKQHSGTIDILPVASGAGTHFRVYLPAMGSSASVSNTPTRPQSQAPTARVGADDGNQEKPR